MDGVTRSGPFILKSIVQDISSPESKKEMRDETRGEEKGRGFGYVDCDTGDVARPFPFVRSRSLFTAICRRNGKSVSNTRPCIDEERRTETPLMFMRFRTCVNSL